ncbi:unnamed protein product [Chondrus crispus]|uniref:Uncharacterized protein n=1 Tax=Chondrus crispus TaxID=2769 RepID=R7QLB6_CHOCR|nr:unnamed protein product [Chondrus crispus]CDF39307.1 unnamed protein product [Chondrus crispus]|eukprot:XP_005719218.1 unnamed protein product [Chondrus crispus]
MALVAVPPPPPDELLVSPKGSAAKSTPLDAPRDADRPSFSTTSSSKLTAPEAQDCAIPAESSLARDPPTPKTTSPVSSTALTSTGAPSCPPPKATVICTRTTSCICEGCAEPHDGSYGSGRFCSVQCARRIAASRKWEKQRSERKRLAAAAAASATATASVVDHSPSSLSSASSLDGRGALKRRRVVMLPQNGVVPQARYHSSATPPPPVLQHPHLQYQHLVQPQPQPHNRHHSIPHHPHPMLGHMQMQNPLLAATPPLPVSSPLGAMPPFMEYGHMPVRTASPCYTPSTAAYYQYQPPMVYTPPPQYPIYASNPMPVMPHAQMPQGQIPPPPPPTPAPDAAHVIGQGHMVQNHAPGVPRSLHAPKAQVSSEKECAAVANALLCLRESKKME